MAFKSNANKRRRDNIAFWSFIADTLLRQERSDSESDVSQLRKQLTVARNEIHNLSLKKGFMPQCY
ncbi:hypothetical protein C0J52_21524 [Blattella germanica]|nr:hypothetical protein C0J52_21524 [Blattella germanica]